jgi:enamine deaminase RidA (YjgF/YER057c/UK114 family)
MISCQTFALTGSPVQPLEIDGRIVGSHFASSGAKFCLLGNIVPPDMSVSPREQCRLLFERIELALRGADMTFRNVMRTWFYLHEILSWYADFNEVRSKFFVERGLLHRPYPASTCVGASNPLGAAIMCNALAIQRDDGEACVQEIESLLQCPAPDYRSTFSRAVEVTLPDCRSLYVSGTASIDRDGATAHVGDADRQIALTMEVVQSILRSRGMNWTDVNNAVAYCKNIGDIHLLFRYLERRGLRDLPLAITRADICREDLLFEVEAEASAGTRIE